MVNFCPDLQKKGRVCYFVDVDNSSLFYTKTSRVSRMRTMTDADMET